MRSGARATVGWSPGWPSPGAARVAEPNAELVALLREHAARLAPLLA